MLRELLEYNKLEYQHLFGSCTDPAALLSSCRNFKNGKISSSDSETQDKEAVEVVDKVVEVEKTGQRSKEWKESRQINNKSSQPSITIFISNEEDEVIKKPDEKKSQQINNESSLPWVISSQTILISDEEDEVFEKLDEIPSTSRKEGSIEETVEKQAQCSIMRSADSISKRGTNHPQTQAASTRTTKVGNEDARELVNVTNAGVSKIKAVSVNENHVSPKLTTSSALEEINTEQGHRINAESAVNLPESAESQKSSVAATVNPVSKGPAKASKRTHSSSDVPESKRIRTLVHASDVNNDDHDDSTNGALVVIKDAEEDIIMNCNDIYINEIENQIKTKESIFQEHNSCYSVC